jgi:hypothetical protein
MLPTAPVDATVVPFMLIKEFTANGVTVAVPKEGGHGQPTRRACDEEIGASWSGSKLILKLRPRDGTLKPRRDGT